MTLSTRGSDNAAKFGLRVDEKVSGFTISCNVTDVMAKLPLAGEKRVPCLRSRQNPLETMLQRVLILGLEGQGSVWKAVFPSRYHRPQGASIRGIGGFSSDIPMPGTGLSPPVRQAECPLYQHQFPAWPVPTERQPAASAAFHRHTSDQGRIRTDTESAERADTRHKETPAGVITGPERAAAAVSGGYQRRPDCLLTARRVIAPDRA